MNRRQFALLAGGHALAAATDIEALVERLIDSHRIPGIALTCFRKGAVEARLCRGVGDRVSNRPIDNATVFEAASLSKPVFATSVLRLVERGEFDLDKPLLGYLGGTYIHVQEPWRPDSATDELKDAKALKLTARLVLSHRTGLPNWRFSRPLTFIREPGEWGYSGEGFVLLQHAVEKHTGKTLDQLVYDEIFHSLKMTRSRYVWSDSLLPNVARGHNPDGSMRARIGNPFAISAGSLVTTLDDYSRFVSATLTRHPPLLGEAMQKAMLTQAGDSGSPGLRWGLGWGLPSYDEQFVFHWGSNPGYKCFVLASLQTGSGVLFFTNSEQGLKVLPDVVPAVFGRDLPLTKWRMLQ